MDNEEEYASPFEPERIAASKPGSVRSYCVSPTNGRLEWIQAKIKRSHLNSGSALSDDIGNFLLAGDKNPFDKPALIIHQSLGGVGNEVYNAFLEGRSFDRETFDNEVESTVYYALKDRDDLSEALVTVKFIFRNDVVTRPYKLAYQVQLPNGDIIENELVNV
ncbi:hypothetical protein BWQ96_03040 [Gracilariopsis chorda]|uniref:Uncharacterized protein n=1 Tax=Gracilariopsis chorda TaxID=448386 RepID=A0A2V3IYX0_9FLOR|nr:hypothetical protein BWQ96_03040 [Gracilariopsis chorda]|eukprot:PXF47265.1 hypothetical protein BWQ96_03040 [Gracilariopsis chorda]